MATTEEKMTNEEGMRQPQMGLTFEDVWAMFQETDKKFRETDKKFQETDRLIKENAKQIGGMSNSDGAAAEELFASSLASKMMFAGQHYDHIGTNIKGKVDELEGEYDIVLYNGTSVALIEIKCKASEKDMKELVTKKLPTFRTLFPMYKDYTIYLGIGSLSFGERVLTKARELGIGILRQKGDTLEVETDHIRAY